MLLLLYQNRKKLIATARRSEGVYNRADKPSVAFCEKGAATEHMKKDRSKNGLFGCSVVCCDVVEARGIEPLSENLSIPGTTSVVFV